MKEEVEEEEKTLSTLELNHTYFIHALVLVSHPFRRLLAKRKTKGHKKKERETLHTKIVVFHIRLLLLLLLQIRLIGIETTREKQNYRL